MSNGLWNMFQVWENVRIQRCKMSILKSESELICPKCWRPTRVVQLSEDPRELDPLLDTSEIRSFRWDCNCGYSDIAIIEIDRIP